ncbi:CheW-like protein [Leptospira yanagawae serovar Saopaulo str. Sao Paulo = ATCC 700523]|uniref:Purine-binding chemotaxis protein CheW n=3 Tax=Leptospira TaxID=171 RepID=A0A4Z1A013_9LEPT|nr:MULTISPECIES: chemotaxis protein CheW [Leptospira]EOQ88823.1 CheW-like protein [Leptospira yanagawae serovar Saopaulo str. Sao Paulo = ATCC 700523]TGL24494.1 purine-binding chemotaxis protein CheW [Leptospira yanagawae]TGL65056.1 purine-binding chemotaxis protein CheW [Leptospira jelokensis]TGM01634.1 purine-binding chemotaxis protein CheW [Leptospira jelokensis]
MAKETSQANQFIHEQYIIFNLGDEEYAIPITIVEEIVKITNLIRVPQSKSYFAGIMDIRGKVVRMIDLAKRLNIKNVSETSDRAIVINVSGKSIGVIVDKVSHVVHFPANQVDPPPPSVKGISSRYITGVGKKDNRFIILIDIEKILTVEEMTELATV